MKIGILNAYDARNRGDLAIVLCQIELLRRKFQNAEILVFSHHAATNAAVLDTPSVESLVHLPPNGSALARLLRPLWDAGCWLLDRRSGKFGQFHSCDLYVLCGGGYLHSSQQTPLVSRNLACMCLEILFAVRTGKPVIQFPQSFGPVTKAFDRWLVQKVCRALPRLTPRSHPSLELLTQWGHAGKAVLVPDIVLLMPRLLPHYYQPTVTRQGLGIAPSNYRFAIRFSGSEYQQYIEKLGEVCRYFHKRTGENIVLFTQVCIKPKDDDSVAVNKLAARLVQMGIPHSKISEQADLSEYVPAVGRLRAFIGSRLHACLFAFSTQTPAIALAYQPKFQGFYHIMQMEDWIRPQNDWEVEWVCRRLDEALDAAANLSPQIEGRMIVLENQMENQVAELLQSAFPPANASWASLSFSALGYIGIFAPELFL